MKPYEWSKKFRDPRSEEPKDIFSAVKELRHGVEQELEQISKAFRSVSNSGVTVVNVGGGSGGGGVVSSGKQCLYVPYTVSGAGIVTVPFTPIGTTSYGVIASVLDSSGEVGLAIPQIPPVSTDTRTTSSVNVRVFNSGTLQLMIILP